MNPSFLLKIIGALSRPGLVGWTLTVVLVLGPMENIYANPAAANDNNVSALGNIGTGKQTDEHEKFVKAFYDDMSVCTCDL